MTRSILTIASLALISSAPVLAAETSVEVSVASSTAIELSIEPTGSVEESSVESDEKGRNRRRRARNTRNRRNNRDGDNQRSDRAERDGDRPADAQGERPQQDTPSTAERRQFRNQHPDAAEHLRNQQGERGERRAEPARQQARSTAHARPNVTTHRSNNHARPRTASHRWHNHWSHGSSLHWYHGVFVYGPNPRHHRGVRSGQYATSTPMPSRAIDRKGAFSVGMTSGTYASGYDLGGDFSDFGMGVNARFRPVEGLGFEVAYSTHDDTFDSDTERTTTMLSPSVQVFLAPWTRLSPYASLGVTWTDRSYNDTWTDGFNQYHTATTDGSFGPHVGIGLEIALGQNAAIDFEARALGYLDTQEAGTVPGAVQTTVGANWYF